MPRYVCVHGHFYQPPRENPWLEAIELQESAAPYHDWNERITAECYAPNASSRILDGRGRIAKIVNNYARMSFNFGPTLLAWLEWASPETYRAVLDGDLDSRKKFGGHGSAIAQAYNHIIMPLANRRDKITQIRWGIRDFEHRFGRKPEGMWLPETAVDLESLDLLAEHGIAFTILAPNQARRSRPLGETEWSNDGVNTQRSYRCVLPSGRSIAIFVYDGGLSRSVAFEGLLRSGQDLSSRLMDGSHGDGQSPRLSHIATDGETYGHHHRHGDMALSFALDAIDVKPEVHLTNYGEFLEKHPPEHEVEIIDDTSWSCSHGVERWRSDCGCKTGGEPHWNQQWREPLRAALDWLRDQLAPFYEQRAASLMRDPWAARDEYIEVILDRSPDNVRNFLNRHAGRELSEGERVDALKLLELQRHALLMYTSCGWFFNEVSGIETVQVIHYAARAVQLAEQLGASVEAQFLEQLDRAKSNLPGKGTARTIYETDARPAMINLAEVAAHFAVSSLFQDYPTVSSIYCYDVERLDQQTLEAGRPQLSIGRVNIRSKITGESKSFSYGLLYLGELNLTGGVREFQNEEAYLKLIEEVSGPFNSGDYPAVIRLFDQELGALGFSIKSLFRDEQKRILDAVWSTSLEEADALARQLYDRYVPLLRFYSEIGLPRPKLLETASRFAINMQLRRALEKPNLPLPQVRSILTEAKARGIELDQTTLGYSVKKIFDAAVERLIAEPRNVANLRRLEAVLELIAHLPFGVDLWKAQNVYFRLLQTVVPQLQEQTAHGNTDARLWLRHFRNVGDRLAVREE